MVHGHYPALEADFERYYQRDLSGIWTGAITLRKAANLAACLPAGAAVYHSEGSDLAWTPAEHLANAHIYATAMGNWQRGGGQGIKPEPLPTPADQVREHNAIAQKMAKARAFQARQKARAEQAAEA